MSGSGQNQNRLLMWYTHN